MLFTMWYNAQCCHGNSVRLSVRLSVSLSNACIVIKRNNRLSIYQHHISLVFFTPTAVAGTVGFHLKYWLKMSNHFQHSRLCCFNEPISKLRSIRPTTAPPHYDRSKTLRATLLYKVIFGRRHRTSHFIARGHWAALNILRSTRW